MCHDRPSTHTHTFFGARNKRRENREMMGVVVRGEACVICQAASEGKYPGLFVPKTILREDMIIENDGSCSEVKHVS